jgi:hypothetical protein
MIDAVRYPSLAKWALVSLAMAILSILLWKTRQTNLRIIGTFDLITAVLMFYGLWDWADGGLLQGW